MNSNKPSGSGSQNYEPENFRSHDQVEGLSLNSDVIVQDHIDAN